MKTLLNRLKRAIQTRRFEFQRYKTHVAPILSRVTLGVNTLVFLGSIATLVSLAVLSGYENTDTSKALLRTILLSLRVLFIIAIAYNVVFNTSMMKRRKPLRWVIDTLMFLTVLPLIYPHPQHPWMPWLEHILYNNHVIYTVMLVYAVISVSKGISYITGRHTNPSVILGSSFLALIIIGSLLLMMPRCLNTSISYSDALFLSTSAVCITGLTPVDISTTFTPTGLLILGLLVQAGGLGVLTFTSFFTLFYSGNISIHDQMMMRDVVSANNVNSLVPTLLYILGFTLVIEILGAVALFACVHNTLGMSIGDELIFSAFHALTAFCNAGFSNIEGGMANPALLHSNQMVYIVASLLILAGGIGFPILVNLKEVIWSYGRRWWRRATRQRRLHEPVHLYDLNTRLVLVWTLVLVVVSSGLFMVFEYNNTMAGMTLWEKIVQSVFNSFVPRSSGFASLPMDRMMNITLLMMVVLMWIGGASQSTAGGVKINTLATVSINLRSILRGSSDVNAFHRRVSINSVRRANAVITLSIISFTLYSFVILWLEPALSVKSLLYETASALFTVGSSLGITSSLSVGSKLVLCSAMFVGRLGVLSLLSGFVERKRPSGVHYPTGNIIIN